MSRRLGYVDEKYIGRCYGVIQTLSFLDFAIPSSTSPSAVGSLPWVWVPEGGESSAAEPGGVEQAAIVILACAYEAAAASLQFA